MSSGAWCRRTDDTCSLYSHRCVPRKIVRQAAAGSGSMESLTEGVNTVRMPTSVAPDGTEIYVRPFPDVNGGRWLVSTGGGRMPLWSRNGRELFYMSPDGAMIGESRRSGPNVGRGD